MTQVDTSLHGLDAHEAPVVDALPLPALLIGVDGRVQHANRAAAEIVERDVAELAGSLFAADLVDPAERELADELVSTGLAGGRCEATLHVGPSGGGRQAVHLTVTPVRDGPDGPDVVGVLVAVRQDETSVADVRLLADRLSRFRAVTSELLAAEDLPTVTNVVIEHIADAAGATVASLSVLRDEDTLELIGLRGGREGVADRYRSYSLAGTPAGDAVVRRQAVFVVGPREMERVYPTVEPATAGDRSLVCLPLMVAGRVLGVATLSFPGLREFSSSEREFYGLMADICAHALDRVRTIADAEDRASKLRFLAQATDELASSLDYEATLRTVAGLAVPWFADWCSIALAVDGELRTLEVAHVDPGKVALAAEYNRRFPPDPESGHGAYEVLRTGTSQLTVEITDEILDAVVSDPEQRRMIGELNLHSALAVPLRTSDRVVGVITWVAGEGGRRFGTDDLAFGEDLARRAAVAIENAHLHTEVREMAFRLQRAILPERLPEIEGWQLAAHYAPAGRLDAGGDFYDVIDLEDGSFAFFIGDVMGHGVQAAAAMAQMKSSVRAFIAVDPSPSWVMTRLDQLFLRYSLEQLVTMVYGVVERSTGRMTIVNAGHLPPVVRRADGSIRSLDVEPDVLLGGGTSPRFGTTVELAPGDALLTCTDGLVERRHEDIDVGVHRLETAWSTLEAEGLQAGLEALVDQVRAPAREDDVAVLVLLRGSLL